MQGGRATGVDPGPAQLGDKGHLKLHFEAKMRLQRVNADGSPLR